MKPQEIRAQLVTIAMQFDDPPPFKNIGNIGAAERRELPRWLEALPDDDPQLVELSSVIENEGHWNEVAARTLAEPSGHLRIWDETRGYRPFLDQILEFARVPRG